MDAFSEEFLSTRNIKVPIHIDPLTHSGKTNPDTFLLIQNSVKMPNGLDNTIHYAGKFLKWARIYPVFYCYSVWLFCYRADDADAIKHLDQSGIPFLN